jgi:hypothetical protein
MNHLFPAMHLTRRRVGAVGERVRRGRAAWPRASGCWRELTSAAVAAGKLRVEEGGRVGRAGAAGRAARPWESGRGLTSVAAAASGEGATGRVLAAAPGELGGGVLTS